ncbi:UxaA family hydrolase [Bacillus sp. USDA818B3_A]|uniref:UxaA family hydrolase n=1 Tax=Bacillus sp. USDA818B3_A TaxID=2698834 RepID=UPI0019237065|nr:UxaA family hydrolase [Bacillus sp. USDA818B3_A]
MAEKTFVPNMEGIVMHPKDNVVTVLRDIKNGEQICFMVQTEIYQIKSLQDLNFGHKMAFKTIRNSEIVYKYGESIGRATADISIGEHVHVHNIEGIRGRGDQKNDKENVNGND